MLTVPGEKTDAAPRVIPMTGKFRELVRRMKSDAEPAHNASVFEVREASASLAGACRKLGLAHMTHHDLRHLFLEQAGSAEGATLLIPDLQRPYVWSPLQVMYLVDSLVRGWPFGSLLLWSVSDEDVAKMPSRPFAPAIDRTGGNNGVVPAGRAPAAFRMVLDGQQRVQSLLLAFGGDSRGFKLTDRDWHQAVNEKRPRGANPVKHWSMAELCLDLAGLSAEFTRAQSVTVWRLVREGHLIPVQLPNGMTRYSADEVAAMAAAGSRTEHHAQVRLSLRRDLAGVA